MSLLGNIALAAVGPVLNRVLGGGSSAPQAATAKVFDWGSVDADYTDQTALTGAGGLFGGDTPTYQSYHFNTLPAGGTLPSSIPSDRVVRDSDGNAIGYYTPGDIKNSKGRTKASAFARVQSRPYGLGWDSMSEGEKWLAQRDYFDRQNNVFQSRAAANSMSIRRTNQPESLALDRSASLYNQQTVQQLAQNQWQFAQQNAAQEGAAYRSRMQALFPGASTWDLLGSSGASGGTGPGALPGAPGVPTPSAGTLKSGPDPAIFAARMQANSQMQSNALQANLQSQQMRLQDSIAKRNAVLQFMNTAIAGAKTPSEIEKNAAAASQSLAQAMTDQQLLRPRADLARSQAVKASSESRLAGVRSELGRQEQQMRRVGKNVYQTRNVLHGVSNSGSADWIDVLGALGGLPGSLLNRLRGASRRSGVRR